LRALASCQNETRRQSAFKLRSVTVLEVPSLPHLLMVLVIFVLVFGAKRVPEIAGSMGKGIREFKRNVRDDASDLTTGYYRSDSPAHSVGTAEQNVAGQEKRTEPKRLIQ
jgi:sec-independent protein translocase protein TatA